MAIPNGYRLLTNADVGKVFGVDLELQIYVDRSVDPISEIFMGERTNFIEEDDGIIWLRNSSLSNATIYYYSWRVSSDTIITMNENLVVESFYTDSNWNNWFYVKDYEEVSDPYNITLTKPKLTVKCANATMEKDLVVQAEVYDGTVEGGEAGSGITPSGTLDITENGTYDVTNYASANVNVEGSGTTVEPPYTSIITNSGSTSYFGCTIPDENGILTGRNIAPGESITIKHYGLFTWNRSGNWGYSWGGKTYAPDTYGTYYCIQTGSVENIYTLSVRTTASGGAD